MSNAGDQLPVIPLLEVKGNAVKFSPWQIDPTALNVGTTGVSTVMVIVAVVAHWPAAGVKV